MTPGFYILDENNVVVHVEDVLVWGRFFEDSERRSVGLSNISPGVQVSTVFLGLDHRFTTGTKQTVPLLFETMVFGGDDDGCTHRYATWDEAAAGHSIVCQEQMDRAGAKGT